MRGRANIQPFWQAVMDIEASQVINASYMLGRDISASHWEHDRCVPEHCFRSGDNEP